MSEPCRLRRGEGYGACADEVRGSPAARWTEEAASALRYASSLAMAARVRM